MFLNLFIKRDYQLTKIMEFFRLVIAITRLVRVKQFKCDHFRPNAVDV